MKTVIITVLLLAACTTAMSDPAIPSGNISMELDGVPLVDVLRMIADQNALNLVVSGDVEGLVTMRLDDVSLSTALDAIITANGYHYFFKDNIIVVRESGSDVSPEMVSATIRLKYIDPMTAKTALDSRISEAGQVLILRKTSGNEIDTYRANRILITERPNAIDDLIALATSMDVPERTVLIEVKIIESKVDNTSKLGMLWPSSLSASLSGACDGSSTSDDGSTTSSSDNNLGVYAPSDGSWTWGRLSVAEVSLVLDFLDQSGDSRLVSNPRIATLENHEAEITSQTVIPIQTINRFSEGAVIQDIVTFQDEEVGLSLKVTPRINEDGRITLDVNPTIENIIGYTGPADSQKPVTTSRTIKTRVTVDTNETLALGGLFKEDEITNEQRVPLLGSIPILGKLLFTHKSLEKTTTDLIILITPTILD